ncbi:MAG: nitrilase-related carbon-nitrogen hydrolase [Patescibacteria group bacterium]
MLLPIFSAILGILAFLPFDFFWIFGLIFLVLLFIFFIKEEKFWRLILGVFIFRFIFISGTVYQTLEPIAWLSSIGIFLGLPITVYFIKKLTNFLIKKYNLNYQLLITNYYLLFLLPFLWTFFDHLEARYSFLPTYIIVAGNSLGSSPFLGLASVGGLITLTFFIALINILIVAMILNFKNKKLAVIFTIIIAFILLVSWQISVFQLQKNSLNYKNLRNSLKIAVISANEEFNIAQFNKLKSELTYQRVDLVIFPEDILNNSTNTSANADFYQNLVKEMETNLVSTFDTVQNQKRYNSTVLFNANGEIVGIYNKNRLTFIGEYWPFNWRPFFFSWILKTNPEFKEYVVFNPQNAYSRGNKKLLIISDIQFASLICLEIHYPGDLKKYKKMGAQFIINPASNRWLNVGKKHFFYLTNNLKRIESVWLKIPIISSGVNDYAGITLPDGGKKLINYNDKGKNFNIFFGEIRI